MEDSNSSTVVGARYMRLGMLLSIVISLNPKVCHILITINGRAIYRISALLLLIHRSLII